MDAGSGIASRTELSAEQHQGPEPRLSESAGVDPDRAVELIPDALRIAAGFSGRPR